MITRREGIMMAIITVSLTVAVALPTILWGRLREANRQVSIQTANVTALQDTTRTYRDSLAVTVNIMALQAIVNSDSLRSLGTTLAESLRREGQTARTLTQTRFQLAEVVRTLRPERVVTVDGERHVLFPISGPLIEGTAEVIAPIDTTRAMRLETSLRVTPFTITSVIGCNDQQQAFVNYETPAWITATPLTREVSPDLCHPYTPVGFGSFRVTLGGLGTGIGIGAVAVKLLELFLGGNDE